MPQVFRRRHAAANALVVTAASAAALPTSAAAGTTSSTIEYLDSPPADVTLDAPANTDARGSGDRGLRAGPQVPDIAYRVVMGALAGKSTSRRAA